MRRSPLAFIRLFLAALVILENTRGLAGADVLHEADASRFFFQQQTLFLPSLYFRAPYHPTASSEQKHTPVLEVDQAILTPLSPEDISPSGYYIVSCPPWLAGLQIMYGGIMVSTERSTLLSYESYLKDPSRVPEGYWVWIVHRELDQEVPQPLNIDMRNVIRRRLSERIAYLTRSADIDLPTTQEDLEWTRQFQGPFLAEKLFYIRSQQIDLTLSLAENQARLPKDTVGDVIRSVQTHLRSRTAKNTEIPSFGISAYQPPGYSRSSVVSFDEAQVALEVNQTFQEHPAFPESERLIYPFFLLSYRDFLGAIVFAMNDLLELADRKNKVEWDEADGGISTAFIGYHRNWDLFIRALELIQNFPIMDVHACADYILMRGPERLHERAEAILYRHDRQSAFSRALDVLLKKSLDIESLYSLDHYFNSPFWVWKTMAREQSEMMPPLILSLLGSDQLEHQAQGGVLASLYIQADPTVEASQSLREQLWATVLANQQQIAHAHSQAYSPLWITGERRWQRIRLHQTFGRVLFEMGASNEIAAVSTLQFLLRTISRTYQSYLENYYPGDYPAEELRAFALETIDLLIQHGATTAALRELQTWHDLLEKQFGKELAINDELEEDIDWIRYKRVEAGDHTMKEILESFWTNAFRKRQVILPGLVQAVARLDMKGLAADLTFGFRYTLFKINERHAEIEENTLPSEISDYTPETQGFFNLEYELAANVAEAMLIRGVDPQHGVRDHEIAQDGMRHLVNELSARVEADALFEGSPEQQLNIHRRLRAAVILLENIDRLVAPKKKIEATLARLKLGIVTLLIPLFIGIASWGSAPATWSHASLSNA